jgi:hypothetical protein
VAAGIFVLVILAALTGWRDMFRTWQPRRGGIVLHRTIVPSCHRAVVPLQFGRPSAGLQSAQE